MISRRTYLSAIIQLSCWLGNMLYVKNFAIDHCLSKITWVLLKDSLSIYPKVRKIFCLQRCVACEVRVNLNYSTELHFTIFYWFKSRTWHCKSNRTCAKITGKLGKQQTWRLILRWRKVHSFESKKRLFSALIRIFQRIWSVRSKRKT